MCKKASQRLHASARISTLMSVKKRKLIINAFITSHFNYCPFIWMCHSRTMETQINRIHDRALKIIYGDNVSSFETLLKKSGSVTIHHRNLQLLATEIYKAFNNLSSSLMSDLFKIKIQNTIYVNMIYLNIINHTQLHMVLRAFPTWPLKFGTLSRSKSNRFNNSKTPFPLNLGLYDFS